MSRRDYPWWGDVKRLIEQYPELKEAMRDQLPAAATAQYGPLTPQSAPGRALESLVVKRLSRRVAAEIEAVEAAIRETARKPTGEARLAIIDLVYWRKSHRLYGAAMEIGYSEIQAKRYSAEFIRLVAFYLGKIPRAEVRSRR